MISCYLGLKRLAIIMNKICKEAGDVFHPNIRQTFVFMQQQRQQQLII